MERVTQCFLNVETCLDLEQSYLVSPFFGEI